VTEVRIKLQGPSRAAGELLSDLQAAGVPAELFVGVTHNTEQDERWHELWMADPEGDIVDHRLWFELVRPVVEDFHRRHRELRLLVEI